LIEIPVILPHHKHMRRLIPIAILLLPLPVLAAGFAPSPAYQECTSLAGTNPQKALAKAEEWLRIDDSVPAHHCRAMALFGMQQFSAAAQALEFVRDKIPPADITLQTYVTHQAAKAWMSAGKSDAALLTIARQIESMGKTKHDNVVAAKLSSELLVQRAAIRSNYGQFAEAVKDLDRAISLTPLNVEVLLARAAVFQQLRDIPLATADAEAVLKLDSKNAKAKELLRQLAAKK